MSNLVDAGNVGAQDRIWNDVGELLGDQIVAVHFMPPNPASTMALRFSAVPRA